MGINLNRMIDQVAKEKGIARNTLLENFSRLRWYQRLRKKYGNRVELEAQYSEDTGEMEIFLFKDVVEKVEDGTTQIDLKTARRELDSEAEIGDQLGVKMEAETFGRIAAQTAKQVIYRRSKTLKAKIFIQNTKIARAILSPVWSSVSEKRNIVINLGRAEAILPFGEQIPRENHRQGDRIRAIILDVRRTQKGSKISYLRKSYFFGEPL